ncbi:hypothetical protein F4782DRAFT_525179 [Xylaria castorea]|nr:hypothetical protein F4782DRAFT_525179 [Xylaria castorea]
MAASRFDNLIFTCEYPTSYPTELRQTNLLPYALWRYAELLNEGELRIFNKKSDDWKIRFWDSHNEKPELAFSSHDCTSLQEIKNHLLYSKQKDPVCRHVFIEANHSLAPLDCSRDMLTSLFSFHQVMPHFLDIVLSFGPLRGRSVSTAVQRCLFQYDHFTGEKSGFKNYLPQLGRSGWEIRLCYNLWSVEKSYQGKCPWAIRQAGLYHSFDFEMGKATWIHIKTNNVLRERVKEGTTLGRHLQAKDEMNLRRSFTAILATHLIVFEWCNESWHQYLSYWECELVEILTKVKEAPIKRAAETLQTADPNSVNEFKLHDLQHLYVLRTKFQEASMILKLNSDILLEIVGLYQNFVSGIDTPCQIREESREVFSSFTQRTNKIIAEMQSERSRITTLISLLDDGKSLFDTIMIFKKMS